MTRDHLRPPRILAAWLALTLAACGGTSGSTRPAGPPPIDPKNPADLLYAQGLAAYDAGMQAVADARALDPTFASTAARPAVARAEASFAAATGFLDLLTTTYPDSIRFDYAGFYAGRASYETGVVDPATVPTAFLGARDRLDATARQRPLSAIGDWIAYYEGRARFHLAALKPPVGPLDAFPAARADFARALALAPGGLYAAGAQYWIGRTWFEEGFALANQAVLDPTLAGSAQLVLQTAERELAVVWTLYPASSHVDGAEYFWGISKVMEPEPISTLRIQDRRDAIARLGLVVATAGTATPSQFVAGAHYWRGNAHYDLAADLAVGGLEDQGELLAAVADFHAVPPPDSHAARALYHLAKSYVWLASGALPPPTCTGGTGPPPTNARDACAACQALVDAPGSPYATSTAAASCVSYITAHGCTYP